MGDTARQYGRRRQRCEDGLVRDHKTFCHRCREVVKTTITGACVACGVMVATPAVGVVPVGGHAPFGPAVTAAPFATADGPHVPESPFTEHVPGAEYGSTVAT